MRPPILLGVPNVSEGRDMTAITAIGDAFAGLPRAQERPARLLDVHSDPDHHRSVFTLAAPQRALADALLRGAAAVVERIDVVARLGADPSQTGQHPYVGAVDVVPVVYLDESSRGAACAEALVVADRIGSELDVPVFLYGELTEEHGSGRTRAELRGGGLAGLIERMATGAALRGEGGRGGDGLIPDFGPKGVHRTAGATLVSARPPLVAFNVQLAAGPSIGEARAIAARVREGGEVGLPGVRAIAVALGGGTMQVSMNVERPLDISLAEVVEAIAAQAPVASAQLVGLTPAAAMEGFPVDLPLLGFDAARQVTEKALGS